MTHHTSDGKSRIGNILAIILGSVLAVATISSFFFLLLQIYSGIAKEEVRNYGEPLLPEEGLFESGPAKGRFLVAARGLRDPRFQETVVILLSYDADGAMGLVINRPTDVPASEMLPDISWLRDRSERVYYGGPVEGRRMFLLIQAERRPQDSTVVFDGVYLSASKALLERLVKSPGRKERFRMYAGYAGWAGGQLDVEIKRGDWHITAADSRTLFETDAHEIWPTLIRRSSAIQVRNSRDAVYASIYCNTK